MLPITPGQLKCISTIFSTLKTDKELKADIIMGFTGGRSGSTKDLLKHEAAELIKHLKTTDPNAAAIDRMKKKILYYAHEMNWYTPDRKVDVKRVDEWCLKFGQVKRKLDNYTYQELPNLVSQFAGVYKHYLKTLKTS